MTRIHLAALLAALAVSAGASAQEAQPGQAEAQPEAQAQAQEQETRTQPEGDSSQTDKEQLPDIDVWEDTGNEDEDVFIPSESISADSSIAFPSDI
jgi:hypothetical protein